MTRSEKPVVDPVRAGLLIGLGLLAVLLLWALWSSLEAPSGDRADGAAGEEAEPFDDPMLTAECTVVDPVHREPLDSSTVRRLFPAVRSAGLSYEADLYYRRSSSVTVMRQSVEHPDGGWRVLTNRLGMREDAEVAKAKPAVRVLVTGDAHVDCACGNEESFPNRLEARLAAASPGRTVEVLNAAAPGYNPYNYLAVLERYLELAPDVFVFVLDGGDDFAEAMRVERHFGRREAPELPRSMAFFDGAGAVGLEIAQAGYFARYPDDETVACTVVRSVTAQMARVAREHGVGLLAVYLPPPSRIQPQRFASLVEAGLAEAELTPDALAVADRLAADWLRFLEEEGIPHLDLAPVLAGAREPLYWTEGQLLNLAGQRLVARAAEPRVVELLD